MKRMLTALGVFFCFSVQVFGAAYSGGSGEPDAPYQITNALDWQTFMGTSADWNKRFILISDVNLAGIDVTPIGNNGVKFTGVFDGGNHTISNATINNNTIVQNVGLFGCLGEGAQICNLRLEDVNVTGEWAENSGGLVGRIGEYYGPYPPEIKKCYVSGTVKGRRNIGGLVGNNFGGSIDTCYSNCAVTGYEYVGGLVGNHQRGTISTCYADCTVTGGYRYAGGLVGYSSGIIRDCGAVGNASGGFYVGGLVGSDLAYIGGYIISNCYSAVAAVSDIPGNVGNVGGFKGGPGWVKNCFWDIEVSGTTDGVAGGSEIGVTGKTNAEMKMISTFSNAGWNISGPGGLDNIWLIMEEGQDYPTIAHFYYNLSETVPLAGSGTEEDPYKINSGEDLLALGKYCFAWDKYVILTADLDLSNYSIRPIGNSSIQFNGNFDGQSFVIRKSKACLFGSIGKNGIVKNLGIEDANISGTRSVGALAAASAGKISDCYSTGQVSGKSSAYIGGLVGLSSGTISSCHSSVNVSGAGSTIGGLVGANAGNSKISGCYASGTVTDTDPNNFGSSAGGLAGSNQGTILGSYAAGNVYVSSASIYSSIFGGGLVGVNSMYGDVNDCYAKGQVSFDDTETDRVIGGLIGLNDGSVKYCYSNGAIGSGQSAEADSLVGGLCGVNTDNVVLASFWDIEASGKVMSAGGKGVTTGQLKTVTIYQNAGWADRDWVIDDGVDSPRLAWENTSGISIPAAGPVPLSGSGTEADPYQVWTAEDLALLSWYSSVLDKHVVLKTDIDLAEMQVYPIGDLGPFTGTLDGNRHVIRNLLIFQPANGNAGLFCELSGGTIKNLGVEDVNIVGGDFVGALIAKNEAGTVERCYSTGNINGSKFVGGLVGRNNLGLINQCYSSATVNSCDPNGFIGCLGGLVGSNRNGTIRDCYGTGSVTSSAFCVGGLLGNDESSDRDWPPLPTPRIERCYSTGAVIGYPYVRRPGIDFPYVNGLVGNKGICTFAQCYWDTETSGTIYYNSKGILGLPTADMKKEFMYGGWDFVGIEWDGTEDIWYMRPGDYPRLTWQNHSPAANSGADQTIYVLTLDANAQVILDASDSNDADGDALTYKWRWEIGGEIYEANGITFTIELPVGSYNFRLVVNDGLADSAADEVNVTVVGPLEGMVRMTPNTINVKSNQPKIDAVIGLPAGIQGSEIDENFAITFYPGEAKAINQNVRGLEFAASFDKDAVCAAMQDGNNEVTVAGKLKSGQWFYATDTIKILGLKKTK